MNGVKKSNPPKVKQQELPLSSSYFSDPLPVKIESTPATPLIIQKATPANVLETSEEDWESQLKSPKRESSVSISAENLGSEDEGERNVNAEIEAFGLSQDDFN